MRGGKQSGYNGYYSWKLKWSTTEKWMCPLRPSAEREREKKTRRVTTNWDCTTGMWTMQWSSSSYNGHNFPSQWTLSNTMHSKTAKQVYVKTMLVHCLFYEYVCCTLSLLSSLLLKADLQTRKAIRSDCGSVSSRVFSDNIQLVRQTVSFTCSTLFLLHLYHSVNCLCVLNLSWFNKQGDVERRKGQKELQKMFAVSALLKSEWCLDDTHDTFSILEEHNKMAQ